MRGCVRGKRAATEREMERERERDGGREGGGESARCAMGARDVPSAWWSLEAASGQTPESAPGRAVTQSPAVARATRTPRSRTASLYRNGRTTLTSVLFGPTLDRFDEFGAMASSLATRSQRSIPVRARTPRILAQKKIVAQHVAATVGGTVEPLIECTKGTKGTTSRKVAMVA